MLQICKNDPFVRDLLQKPYGEVVKTTLPWETSFKTQVKVVKTKLSCEAFLENCKLTLWKRSFRARPPSKTGSLRCENDVFLRDFLPNLQLEVAKTKPEPSVPLQDQFDLIRAWSKHSPRPSRTSRAADLPHPSSAHFVLQRIQFPASAISQTCPTKTATWQCENEAFVRDFLQKLQVDVVKTTLPRKTSFKNWKLKLCKRSFRARLPSKTASWSCANDASVRELLQKLQVEVVKTTLPCETSFKISSRLSFKNCYRSWRRETTLSCGTSFKTATWTCEKRSFRAKPPSRTGSWSCGNEAFVRDFLQKLQVEVVQTTLLCENSFKNCKLKLWKRRFRARPPLKFLRGFPSKTATVVDVGKQRFRAGPPSKLQLELAKTKLSRKTSFKNWKLKLWKRSFRARLPSKPATCFALFSSLLFCPSLLFALLCFFLFFALCISLLFDLFALVCSLLFFALCSSSLFALLCLCLSLPSALLWSLLFKTP